MPVDPLSFLGLGIEVIRAIRGLVNPKLSVNPKLFVVSDTKWKVVKPFSVCNKSDEPLFDVQVVIWTSTKDPVTDLSIEDQEKGYKTRLGSITINTESRIFTGERQGQPLTIVQIGSIAPKSCKKVYLGLHGPIKVKLEVVKFSKEPPHITVRGNSVAIPFQVPFDMTIKSSGLLMKRDKSNG